MKNRTSLLHLAVVDMETSIRSSHLRSNIRTILSGYLTGLSTPNSRPPASLVRRHLGGQLSSFGGGCLRWRRTVCTLAASDGSGPRIRLARALVVTKTTRYDVEKQALLVSSDEELREAVRIVDERSWH